MIRFRQAQHSVLSGVEIIEVWDNDVFLATICPGNGENVEAKAVNLVSRHFNSISAMPEHSRKEPAAAQAVSVGFK